MATILQTLPLSKQKIFTNPNKELEFVVQRDNNLEILTVVPEASDLRGKIGEIKVASTTDVFVSGVVKGSLAANAGIMVGDQVETIDGQKLYTVPVFNPGIWHPKIGWPGAKYQAYYNHIDQKQDTLELGIGREDEKLTFQLPVTWQIRTFVQKKSTAAKAGIQNGDVLVSFNGKPVDIKSFFTELEKVEGHTYNTRGSPRGK